MSSAKRLDKNILAHPTGGAFLSANFSADCLRTKMPPTRPSVSRATQNPSRFRPMKNSGIASLRMLGSGRCSSLVAEAGRTNGITVAALAGGICAKLGGGLLAYGRSARQTGCSGNVPRRRATLPLGGHGAESMLLAPFWARAPHIVLFWPIGSAIDPRFAYAKNSPKPRSLVRPQRQNGDGGERLLVHLISPWAP